MQNAIEQFRKNIQSVRNLDAVYSAVERQPLPDVDVSEILRAEVVFAVSALDCFVHDAVRIGMIEIFQDAANPPEAFNRFSVSMECLRTIRDLSDVVERTSVLSEEIRRLNGYKSFQDPENIAKAISVLGVEKIWKQIGQQLKMAPKDVKDQLKLIVEQRNRIVHEADFNPSLGDKNSIDHQIVRKSVAFIESVCEQLFLLITKSLAKSPS